jgi:hypothetical protein
MYCGKESINYPMFVVQRELKPKGRPHRKMNVGHCCDHCEANGRVTLIKYEAADGNQRNQEKP